MEALGALAVATRHIRALSTARADRGRAGDATRSARREPASRVVPPRSASGAWRHARLALPVRQGIQFAGPATDQSTSRRPVRPDLSWRTERARVAGGRSPWSPERALFSRVRGGAGVRARISRSATASGPRAFNASRRVRCCRRHDFLPGYNYTKPALPSQCPDTIPADARNRGRPRGRGRSSPGYRVFDCPVSIEAIVPRSDVPM
mgnify:CR=1 FL=1